MAQRLGLDNATFVARDVAALDITEAFDVITAFDAIHDQAHPARVLENIHRALRPGGSIWISDLVSHELPAVQAETPIQGAQTISARLR